MIGEDVIGLSRVSVAGECDGFAKILGSGPDLGVATACACALHCSRTARSKEPPQARQCPKALRHQPSIQCVSASEPRTAERPVSNRINSASGRGTLL